MTMQGRGASKASKKELVIESPQQYQSLAPCEAEPAPVPQVVVSRRAHPPHTHTHTHTHRTLGGHRVSEVALWVRGWLGLEVGG